MELRDIIDVNELFTPMYPFVARQVIEAFGRDSGVALEIGPFAGGVSIALAREVPELRIILGDDFPGITSYFENKVRDASLADRIEVRSLRKTDLPFPEGSLDLVVFRGGLFFWEERVQILREAYRVLRNQGLAMVGGGFGAGAPDSLIESIANQSRELNRKLGKTVLTEGELAEALRAAGISSCSTIDRRHGLWALVRKPDAAG